MMTLNTANRFIDYSPKREFMKLSVIELHRQPSIRASLMSITPPTIVDRPKSFRGVYTNV